MILWCLLSRELQGSPPTSSEIVGAFCWYLPANQKSTNKMRTEQIKKPNAYRVVGRQLQLCNGSTVVGASVFWLLMVLVDDVRGGASLDNLFFMVAILPIFIALGTLIFLSISCRY